MSTSPNISSNLIKTQQVKSAVIYTRVSSEHSTKTASVESQEEACRVYAERHGYKIISVFTERFTGEKLYERKELEEARELVRTGKAQAIIVHTIDRLSRGGISHLSIIYEELKKYNAKLECVLERVEDSQDGELLMYLKAHLASVERTKIAERTWRGRMQKAKQGKVPGGGGAPYGYRVDETVWRYIIHEPEAMVVRLIYAYAEQFKSLRWIANKLTVEGIPTPSASMGRKNVGRRWSEVFVKRVLTSRTYIGYTAFNTRSLDSKTKKIIHKPVVEHIVVENGADSIISIEQWERVNARIATNIGGDAKRNESRFVLLRGMVSCLRCGSRASAGWKNKKNNWGYFRCRSWTRHEACGASVVSLKWLTEQATNLFIKALSDPEWFTRTKDDQNDVEAQLEQLQKDKQTLLAKVKKLEEGRQRLVEGLLEADLRDKDVFHRVLANQREECESIERHIKEIEALIIRLRDSVPTFPTLLEVAKHWDADVFKKLASEEQWQMMKSAKFNVFFDGRKFKGSFPKWDVLPSDYLTTTDSQGNDRGNTGNTGEMSELKGDAVHQDNVGLVQQHTMWF